MCLTSTNIEFRIEFASVRYNAVKSALWGICLIQHRRPVERKDVYCFYPHGAILRYMADITICYTLKYAVIGILGK